MNTRFHGNSLSSELLRLHPLESRSPSSACVNSG
jgi:hypothetical protein